MKLASRIDDQDNVAMAMDVLHQGETLSVLSDKANEVDRVTVAQDVPLAYHKVALTAIAQRDPIFKYGEVIGYATTPIERGEWLHLHNIESVNYRRQTTDDGPSTCSAPAHLTHLDLRLAPKRGSSRSARPGSEKQRAGPRSPRLSVRARRIRA